MTDYWTANTINDLIRSVFVALDKAVYTILGWMYQILFNVASADIFSSETVRNFYGRIQLILGVFMIFRLAISIIQGIINPDTFTDKKQGFSNIITRIIFALVMLTVLTPINIPNPQNEYEKELNDNGLLFGTLYSLQTRILENNTLGRLILGTTDNATNTGGANTQGERLSDSANIFTSTILKGFVRINLKSKDGDETEASDRVCENISSDVLKVYTAKDADPNEILSLVNASCKYQGGVFEDIMGFFDRLGGNDRYVFAYIPLAGSVVGVIFIWILLGEIITIAIRTIKLAVLRIIAPIPILSYVQPSKDGGAFGAWTKALTSTYLELFLHLAVIYFVLFLIQDMLVNGIVINISSGIIGTISFIFIMLGLFFFIKQAPRFIMNVMGIKGGGTSVGLTGLLSGTSMLMGGGGVSGFMTGFMGGTQDAIDGYNSGKPGVTTGMINKKYRDLAAQMRTGNDKAHGGLYGRLQDRMEYEARERNADRMGYSKRNLAIADAQQKQWQSLLATREDEYDDAKLALDEFAKTHDRAADPVAYDSEYARLLGEVKNARAARNAVQLHYTKSKAAKDKIDKYRSTLRVSPFPRDTVVDTYRSEESAIDGYSNTPTRDGGTHITDVDSNFESSAEDFNPYKE